MCLTAANSKFLKTNKVFFLFFVFLFFFFFGHTQGTRKFLARDLTCTTAVTRAAVVTMLDP